MLYFRYCSYLKISATLVSSYVSIIFVIIFFTSEAVLESFYTWHVGILVACLESAPLSVNVLFRHSIPFFICSQMWRSCLWPSKTNILYYIILAFPSSAVLKPNQVGLFNYNTNMCFLSEVLKPAGLVKWLNFNLQRDIPICISRHLIRVVSWNKP